MSEMEKPVHPGALLQAWLTENKVNCSRFARHVHFSQNFISNFARERRRCTIETALRFADATGIPVMMWMQRQINCDIAAIREAQEAGSTPKIFRFKVR
jgi:addiction module HigA family antidote